MLRWLPLDEPPGLIGWKAHRLGLLQRDGLPVPSGCVAVGDPGSDPIQPPFPPPSTGEPSFAVRSSSVDEDLPGASRAGHYLTRLSVDLASFDAAVRAVRGSGGPDRPCAVLVQPMIAAEWSGVVQTALPTNDLYWLIEAGPGAGRITDGRGRATVRYVFDPTSGQRRRLTGDPPVWAAGLERVSASVSGSLGTDRLSVEFAIASGVVWILQARPLPLAGQGGHP